MKLLSSISSRWPGNRMNPKVGLVVDGMAGQIRLEGIYKNSADKLSLIHI